MYHGQRLDLSHFALHVHGDVDNDVGVQCDQDGELAHRFQRAVGHTHLRLGNALKPLSCQSRCNVHSGDRTEQTAIDTCLLGHFQRVAIELGADSFSGGKFFSLLLFEFGATSLELLQCGVGGTTCNFLGNQVIAGVAITYAHDFTEVTQIHDFFEKYDLHDDNLDRKSV